LSEQFKLLYPVFFPKFMRYMNIQLRLFHMEVNLKFKRFGWLGIAFLGLAITAFGWLTPNTAAAVWTVNSALPDDSNCTTATRQCRTIGAAVDAATNGDVINVGAGTYTETVTISRSLTLNGANAGVNPNTGTRAAESVVIPALNDQNQAIFKITASNVTLNGFTFDGDNPTQTGKEGFGLDTNAGFAIYTDNTDNDNLDVRYNIIRNFGKDALYLFGTGPANPSSGSVVRFNKFDNVVDGAGVVLIQDFFADVSDNVMTRVRHGVRTETHSTPTVSPATISNNTVSAIRSGVMHNNQYGTPTPFTISGNNVSSHPTSTVFAGFWVITLYENTTVTLTNNTVTGGRAGYEIWNVRYSSGITLSNSTVSNTNYGVWLFNQSAVFGSAQVPALVNLDNFTVTNPVTASVWIVDDPAAPAAASVKVSARNSTFTGGANGVIVDGAEAFFEVQNSAFNGQTGDYIKLVNSPNDINAASVTFNGVNAANATPAQLNAIGAKITDKQDNAALGRVLLSGCTVNSAGGANYTTIQAAVNEPTCQTISVAAGTYTETVTINRAVDLRGANYNTNPITGTRTAESIVYPPVNNPSDNNNSAFILKSPNIRINGFTIDGDNPALTGGVNLYGADVNGATGIYQPLGFELTGVSLTNNIVKNLRRNGVYFEGVNVGPPAGVAVIRSNVFDNMSSNDSGIAGRGVIIFQQGYADVSDNVMTRVFYGIEDRTFGSPAAAGPITPGYRNNRIESVRAGIFHNNFYGSASTLEIAGNVISTVPTSTINSGLRLWSQFNTTSLTVTNNTVSGANRGYELWSLQGTNGITITGGTVVTSNYGVYLFNGTTSGFDPFAGSDIYLQNMTISQPISAGIFVQDTKNQITQTLRLTTTNVTITGGTDGVLVQGSQAFVTPNNLVLSGQTGNYFRLITSTNNINARNVSFEGKTGAQLGAAEYAAVQAKIVDKNDDPALGLVILGDPTLLVTPSALSFSATLDSPNPSSRVITLSALAAGGQLGWTLGITYTGSPTGWLNCQPTSGTLAGGSSQPVTCSVSISGLAAGTYLATVTVTATSGAGAVANSPFSIPVTLTVGQCSANTVNSTSDGLSCGTLRYAVANSAPGATITVTLAAGSTINLTGTLTIANRTLVGSCGGSGPGITLNGSGAPGSAVDGLVISGGTELRGLWVRGFSGRQIVASAGSNKLNCVRASKN
jgi:hypothetical protein